MEDIKALRELIDLTNLVSGVCEVIQVKKTRRSCGVRKIFQDRETSGYYKVTFLKMKDGDPGEFFKQCRMNRERFDFLLSLIEQKLLKRSRRAPISPGCRLAVTLTYLAQAVTVQYLAWSFKLGKETVRQIILETCDSIWKSLHPLYVTEPTRGDFEIINQDFERKWGVPHCIGSIDGKHIAIDRPRSSGALFYNYKKFYSIVLLGACDARYTFTFIDVGGYGGNSDGKSVCGGHCCSNKTETELLKLATSEFESMLHHHTRSLRGVLETTSNAFRGHVIDLLDQSEEKTLNVFSQVYRRMLPLSKELIGNLYTHIRSYFTAASDSEPEQHLRTFFYNLFPIAYHQTVHLNNGDLPEFYIACLKLSYDDLNPFGEVPKDLSKSLTQSLDAGRLFIDALQKAGEVLDEADKLDSLAIIPSCRTHLLKMTYCRQCHGHAPSTVKSCYGYCKNVIRGCLSQFLGMLDGPWSNVAEAIETFVSSSILSETGVISVIKRLDTKLSEAIMQAMENGPELEKKIKKACGSPELLPAKNSSSGEPRATQVATVKWATPPDAQFINFLSTIEKSRYFYSKTGDNLCEEGEYQRNDQHCWTGDSIGDYTKHVLSTGLDSQRYNPEIPLLTIHSYPQAATLNTLVDKLIKLRSTIVNTLPSNSRSYSDIQSDMARHDEEGSGARADEFDDDDTAGSGSGSGELTPPPFDGAVSPTSPTSRSETTAASPSLSSFISVLQILVVYTIVSILSH